MWRLLRALKAPSARRGKLITRIVRGLLVLGIGFLLYDWLLGPIALPVTMPIRAINPNRTVDVVNLCVALAGMNATVGAIVIVFVVLAVQELRVLQSNAHGPIEIARLRRDKSRLDMLLGVAIVSFVILMSDAITMLFALIGGVSDERSIAALGLGGFTFGLASIAIAIFSYRVLESPFVRITALSALEVHHRDDSAKPPAAPEANV